MAKGRAKTAPASTRDRSGFRLLIVVSAINAAAFIGLGGWLLLAGPPAPVTVAVDLPQPPKPEPEPPPAAAPEPEPAAPASTIPAPPPIGRPPGFNEGRALLPAPDPDLIESAASGFLPVIGRDGRQPWQVYGRPFDLSDTRPRIAILIGDLGVSQTTTENAITQLPAPVTLAFATYKKQLGEWINMARSAGHEVLLDLPLEPNEYPRTDPGPNALLTSLAPEENMRRLEWNMSQATGYVGLVGFMGSRFSASRDDMQPLLQMIKKRGLLYVDNRSTPQTAVPGIANETGLPMLTVNRLLDGDPTRAAVDKKLSELEDVARRTGGSLGLAQRVEPVVLERIGVWAQGLEDRGLVLAPVSAVIEKQKSGGDKPKSDEKAKPDEKGKPAEEKKAAPAAEPKPAAAGSNPTAQAAKPEHE
ncbi:MAG TPA: divergent polysaccharide deacetylase family protein [Aliidongia sp.]|nr:divergent polysaccharide deacetylase family protein [Aliidongia sp.]